MDPATIAMIAQMGQSMGGGLSQFFGGMFGNSGAPYEDYGKEYEKYADRGIQAQNPFYNAGKQGMGEYQDWLQGQKDPNAFINSLMQKYQTSPYAKFQMQQGQNAANNAASASGMMGSTPYMQASQDYARNIASQDQNSWLQNVLGINTQYGQGQGNMMGVGQHAADQLSGINERLGENMGAAAYGERMGRNKDTANMIGGASKFLFG